MNQQLIKLNRCREKDYQLLKELAFQDIGFDRIFTETYALRTHHISVLESIGFDREGVLRNHIKIDGRSVDSIIHGCIKI